LLYENSIPDYSSIHIAHFLSSIDNPIVEEIVSDSSLSNGTISVFPANDWRKFGKDFQQALARQRTHGQPAHDNKY